MMGKHSLQITELVIQHKAGYKEDLSFFFTQKTFNTTLPLR